MKLVAFILIILFPNVVFSQSNDNLILIKQNKKFGFKNIQNKIVIPCIYDSAFAFSEGVTPVKKIKNGFILTV